MALTSPQTLTAAGTRQQLLAVPTDGLPGARWVNRVTIQLISGTAYFGVPGPIGLQDTVSSTVYNVTLNTTFNSVTIGPVDQGNGVDLCSIWWDGTTGAVIALMPVVSKARA
jgi:hypothetical protein